MSERHRGILPIAGLQQANDASKQATTDTSARVNGIRPLTITAGAGYVQADFQAVIDKVNEILAALQAKTP